MVVPLSPRYQLPWHGLCLPVPCNALVPCMVCLQHPPAAAPHHLRFPLVRSAVANIACDNDQPDVQRACHHAIPALMHVLRYGEAPGKEAAARAVSNIACNSEPSQVGRRAHCVACAEDVQGGEGRR